MKLSIITVTYNRPEHLRIVALASIFNETEPNFEWVVVNDGANLQVREIISQLILDFPIIYQE
ncbi:glycosyltransferase [Brasilonema sp. CT11]|nr:glycosyltransferase [Brasilonema sp. CT11]